MCLISTLLQHSETKISKDVICTITFNTFTFKISLKKIKGAINLFN